MLLSSSTSTTPPRPTRLSLPRRLLLAIGIAAALLPIAAQAQETPIKFQLDWRFEGPAAMFLVRSRTATSRPRS